MSSFFSSPFFFFSSSLFSSCLFFSFFCKVLWTWTQSQRWPQLNVGEKKAKGHEIKGHRFLKCFPTRMIIKFRSRFRFDIIGNSLSSISNYKTRTVYDFSAVNYTNVNRFSAGNKSFPPYRPFSSNSRFNRPISFLLIEIIFIPLRYNFPIEFRVRWLNFFSKT